MSTTDASYRIPDWFRPRNQEQEDTAQSVLIEGRRLEKLKEERVGVMRSSMIRKVEDMVRRYDGRSLSFLGGNCHPWTKGSWESVQRSRHKRLHPVKYVVWRMTGLMGPACIS